MSYISLSIRRFIQVILAILSLVFLVIEGLYREHLGIAVAIVSAYLVLVVILALVGHDVSGSSTQAIDCAAGFILIFEAITALMLWNKTLQLAAAVLALILGILFWVFALF